MTTPAPTISLWSCASKPAKPTPAPKKPMTPAQTDAAVKAVQAAAISLWNCMAAHGDSVELAQARTGIDSAVAWATSHITK